jgi:UDP-glucose 4-epimerase
VLHTHLEVDSTRSSRRLHEVDVIGTMNLLAAAAADGSPVRKVVVGVHAAYGSN